MKGLFERLDLKVDKNNEFWQNAFSKAIIEPEIPFFISKEFIEKIQNEYQVLPKNYQLLLSVVDEIRKNKDLCLLSKILYHLLFLEVERKRIFEGFILPKPPKDAKNTLAYDLFSVFPIMAHIPFSFKILEDRGIEREICISSHCQLDTCISEASAEQNRPCFTTAYFMCYRAFIYLKVLRIGRFRFETIKNSNLHAYAFENKKGEVKILMHDITLHKSGNVLGNLDCNDEQGCFVASVSEDDRYFYGYLVDKNTCLADNKLTKLDKNEWTVLYKPNADIVEVHIPFDDSFDNEYCQWSYEKAREVFKKCYKEFDFKCFATGTWFLAPALEKVLKPTSNIYKFRQNYNVFPAKCSALSVFEYVYKLNPNAFSDVDIENLSDDNSLKKGIKEQLKKGEYIYEFNGLFKF